MPLYWIVSMLMVMWLFFMMINFFFNFKECSFLTEISNNDCINFINYKW